LQWIASWWPVQASLFMGIFSIHCSSASINIIERQLQLVLNRLYKWSFQNGFTFSPSKTCSIHFCRKCQLLGNPVVHLGDTRLPFVESTKFLWLHYDRSLWRIVTQLHVKGSKSLNIFCILSGRFWGADRVCLLCLYHALVRSVLHYAYASAGTKYCLQEILRRH
jgi:hypothetical protein